MKISILLSFSTLLLFMGFSPPNMVDEVTYQLRYDSSTQTYTLAVRSATAYSGSLSRLSSSTQVSVVFPHTTGGFQITNLTDLQTGGTPLDWGFSRIDAPAENSDADYLFFAPANANGYTTFDFPANTFIDLFSFQSGSGCLGEIQLYDNDTDPLNANNNLNSGNNFVILGGGLSNKYFDNQQPVMVCGGLIYHLSYDSATGVYTVAAESNQSYTGNLARLSSSTQVSIVFPSTPGGFQITNLTDLQTAGTPLDWNFSRIDTPVENTDADYLFFTPANANSYTPFDFPANTKVDLFSFESDSGCLGEVLLFDNDADPLNANTSLNSDNNFVVLAGGLSNQYTENNNGAAACAGITYCLEFDQNLGAFVVSIESDAAYAGAQARFSPSTQISIVAPAVSGGYVVSDLTGLQTGGTALTWASNQLNAPAENTAADYLFFAPANATSYTPFDIPANTKIQLFSFKSGGVCTDLNVFDNENDPLNTNPLLNPDNSITVLGAGPGSQFIGLTCAAACCCEPNAPIISKN